MKQVPFGKILLALVLGFFAGAVAGFVLDRILGTHVFSTLLLKEALTLELYIIKVELQITPASLVGLVVTLYFVLKKGY